MTSQLPREQHLIISALGSDAASLTSLLCRSCLESRCSIIASKLNKYGEFSAMTLQVGGNWDALARLENLLPAQAKKAGILLNFTRSNQSQPEQPALPYMVYVNALYQPDTLHELCQFFAAHQVELDSISYDSFAAPQTNTKMLNAILTVQLPADVQISWLRERFLDFAEALNLDAMIEPWRPQLN